MSSDIVVLAEYWLGHIKMNAELNLVKTSEKPKRRKFMFGAITERLNEGAHVWERRWMFNLPVPESAVYF